MNPYLTSMTLEAAREEDPTPRNQILLLSTNSLFENYNLFMNFGEVLWIAGSDSSDGRILQCLGSSTKLAPEDFRVAGGLLANWLIDHQIIHASLSTDQSPGLEANPNLNAYLEGLLLGSFTFADYKTGQPQRPVHLRIQGPNLTAIADQIGRATAVASAVNYARSIAQQPPNVINPASLAAEAESLATTAGLHFRHLGSDDLLELGAGAITAVGQGSQTQSELIILEHSGHGEKSGEAPIVILGKAITFDTGGYAIKSLYGMATMKYDKCGGAAVLGIMKGVAELQPERRIIGVVAAAENMISDKAYRPNDIIRSLSGKTIEIISTDAEGRLVLADAITYACQNFKPSVMVDLATLTGGAYTALGKIRAGLLSTDRALVDLLMDSGERTHERLWPLPLDEEYFELIRGKDSDLVNSFHHAAGVPVPASTIMGGMFLKQFVEGPYPWAHIDIAATAKSKSKGAYIPRGATGFGVRLMLDFIENYEGL